MKFNKGDIEILDFLLAALFFVVWFVYLALLDFGLPGTR